MVQILHNLPEPETSIIPLASVKLHQTRTGIRMRPKAFEY